MGRARNLIPAAIGLFALVIAAPILAKAQNGTQPEMRAALQSLRDAENSLQRASRDKGGHRGRAIDLIRQAEREVQAGIDYDNRHLSPGERRQYFQGEGGWRGRLSPDEQQKFDSYYSRWMEYRRTNNREQVESMERRMHDLMAHNNIPANVPFEQIASNPAY
jgi:hypothetical protein